MENSREVVWRNIMRVNLDETELLLTAQELILCSLCHQYRARLVSTPMLSAPSGSIQLAAQTHHFILMYLNVAVNNIFFQMQI